MPVLRHAVGRFRLVSVQTAAELLRSEYHEIRLFALLLMMQCFALHPKEQENIYRVYLGNTAHINNRDLVDSSAPHIVGAWLASRNRKILYQLAGSASLWERRIAIMASFHFIRIQQFTDTLRLAKQLLQDEHDLIHKAVGWMLREVGNREIETELEFSRRMLPSYAEEHASLCD